MAWGRATLSGGRSSAGCRRGANGNHDPERRPGADLALDHDAAAMPVDDAVDDRQAEPGPLADVLGREEGIENLRDHVGRDAGAVVGDGDLDVFRLLPGGDADRAAAVSRADALADVGDQFHDPLIDLAGEAVEPQLGIDLLLDANVAQ